MLRLWISLMGREAFRSLLRHKLRSGLATLGVTIGIAAMVLMVAVGQAGTARAQAELDKLGDNLVWIEAGSRNVNGIRSGSNGDTSLTMEDAEAIRREIPLIRDISPQIDGTVSLRHGNRSWTTRYRGESAAYVDIKRWDLAAGAPFTDLDVQRAESKLLIGETVRHELFGADEDPIGQVIRVQSQLFEVVGVLAPKGQSADGRDQDDWVLMPHTTAQAKIRGKGSRYLDDILCSAVSAQAVDPAIDRVIGLLRQRHHIAEGEDDDFNIRRPDEVLKAQVATSDTMAAYLISVASISLLVGGIGIMNVMLASVAQRTREIGVRLAVGATPGAVQVQFLGEAVMLCVVGGIGGVLASAIGAYGFESVLDWPIAIPPRAVALALVSSIGVGVCFGFYPAWRAARLDPLVALRAE
jgi:putative ABC transport system permease protein